MEPDLSGIRLIAADMDGTLLNDRNELSPDFYPLFNALKKKNVLFAAASGRQSRKKIILISSPHRQVSGPLT